MIKDLRTNIFERFCSFVFSNSLKSKRLKFEVCSGAQFRRRFFELNVYISTRFPDSHKSKNVRRNCVPLFLENKSLFPHLDFNEFD